MSLTSVTGDDWLKQEYSSTLNTNLTFGNGGNKRMSKESDLIKDDALYRKKDKNRKRMKGTRQQMKSKTATDLYQDEESPITLKENKLKVKRKKQTKGPLCTDSKSSAEGLTDNAAELVSLIDSNQDLLLSGSIDIGSHQEETFGEEDVLSYVENEQGLIDMKHNSFPRNTNTKWKIIKDTSRQMKNKTATDLYQEKDIPITLEGNRVKVKRKKMMKDRNRKSSAKDLIDNSAELVPFNDTQELILSSVFDMGSHHEEAFGEEKDVEEDISSNVENGQGFIDMNRNIFDRLVHFRDSCFMVLAPNERVSFVGQGAVFCLFGSASICGYIISACKKNSVSMFSPKTHSLLSAVSLESSDSLLACENNIKILQKRVKKLRRKLSIRAEFLREREAFLTAERTVGKICSEESENESDGVYQQLTKILENFNHATVLLFEPLKKPYLVTHGLRQIWHESTGIQSQLICRGLYVTFAMDRLNFPSEVQSAASVIEDSKHKNCRTIVIGDCNQGKSTMCRYLINRLLGKHSKVAFLDTDLGQSEMSAPGMIALHLVTKPLLGPSFTHMSLPLRACFCGVLSPTKEPLDILNSVHYVLQALPADVPLVVNTMGWVKSMGLSLLSAICFAVQPNQVIQMGRIEGMEMFTMASAKTAVQDSSLFWKTSYLRTDVEEWDTIVCPGQSRFRLTTKTGSQIPNPVNRSLNLMACIGGNRPVIVSWNHFAIHVMHVAVPNSLSLHAINNRIVAISKVSESIILESRDSTLPKFLAPRGFVEGNCLGVALVKYIDSKKKVFHLQTTVDEQQLKSANCLLMGEIQLCDASCSFDFSSHCKYHVNNL